MKNRLLWKNVILLQGVVMIYTLSSMMAKFAAKQQMLTVGFFLFYGLELVFLGIYAVCWQQMIKKFELSVAYANRAMALVWSMIWAFFIFHEKITGNNIIGVLLVMAGIMIINTGDEAHDK